MKKGFTLIEMVISIGLISVLILVAASLFTASQRQYAYTAARTKMQNDLNFSMDSITNNIKLASVVPTSYSTYTRGADTLILGIPAKDSNQGFLYNGANLKLDYIVYFLQSGSLKRAYFGDSSGVDAGRSQTPQILVNNVSAFNCTYSPTDVPQTVSCTYELQKAVRDKNILISATRSANLRNKQ
jgi:prepilin-type N-terminal cleavage/methylation domain-containing protein